MKDASRKEHSIGAATRSAHRSIGRRGQAGRPVRTGIAAALVVFLAIGAGCGGGDDGAGRLIDESTARTASLKTFRFVVAVTSEPISGSGLPLTTARGDVAVPDRIEAEVGGNYGSIPHTARVISIGDDVWRREPLAGRWSWVEPSSTPLAYLDPALGVIAVISGVRGAQVAGSASLDGIAMHKLTARASARDVAPLVGAGGGEEEVTVTLWIGEDDKLLHRVDVLGRVGRGEDLNAARTVRLSRFNQPVTISAPLPPPPEAESRGDAQLVESDKDRSSRRERRDSNPRSPA